MATGISSPPSRLDPAPGLDHLQLARRGCGVVLALLAEPSLPAAAPDRCNASAEDRGASGVAQLSWPGLPRGVEFNPSDTDLLWHLAAEVGNALANRHPFISEFIKPVDDDRGFSCSHPQDIPGVWQDGRASYFFHRRFELYINDNDRNISWQKIGTPRSIILDRALQGCKEEFVLCADMLSDKNPWKTDWRLHQYHIKKYEGELVLSKIFCNSQNNQCELTDKASAESGLMQGEVFADQNKLSYSKVCGSCFNSGIQMNGCTEIDELDHLSLQERYRILRSDKTLCPSTPSAGKSVMGAGTSGTSLKRNHEGTAYKEDMCSMLQEISSAPPIIESNPMDDVSNRGLLGEDISGTFLADIKLEPALEGYEIDHSQSPQAKFSHAEGSLPSLGVKGELTECELPGFCENSSINTAENIIKTTRTRILDHDEGVSFGSRQRRKRKTTSYSTDKEDAYTNAEGVVYGSRQRRRKKTATDSIETALDEDAPGLLQILLNKGITVEEIKLYGADEDDEVLPDSTESDFEDLENIMSKLFPQRASLLKLSVARHEKGERAAYCLSCLISLIEQSRYLHFRGCPVEWGWCRDLQSFIFVFRSHNRIVLERPEYGYATYFFEVVQSQPIEWQIRRLVIAMKLSGCGRTALIENRPLMVGEDLSEGEAHVLEEYGWVRNTGLGTMLNYCDRVVHDRWTEKSVTDWRVKIGKLLMTGYARGESVKSHAPKKVLDLLEYTEDSEIEIKLEDPF